MASMVPSLRLIKNIPKQQAGKLIARVDQDQVQNLEAKRAAFVKIRNVLNLEGDGDDQEIADNLKAVDKDLNNHPDPDAENNEWKKEKILRDTNGQKKILDIDAPVQVIAAKPNQDTRDSPHIPAGKQAQRNRKKPDQNEGIKIQEPRGMAQNNPFESEQQKDNMKRFVIINENGPRKKIEDLEQRLDSAEHGGLPLEYMFLIFYLLMILILLFWRRFWLFVCYNYMKCRGEDVSHLSGYTPTDWKKMSIHP